MRNSIYNTTQNKYKTVGDSKTVREKHQQAQYLYSQIKKMNIELTGDFLDVGCGMGVWANYVKNTTGARPFGIDLSKKSINLSKKYGINAVVTDIEKKWPYKNNSFNFICAIQVIEHLLNPDFFLKEAHRVVKTNGYVIITTPNLASWFNRIIFLFGFQPFTTEVSTIDKTLGLKFTRRFTSVRKPMGHIRAFTQKALIDILELHGFRVYKNVGGEVNYLPKFMKYFDKILSHFPSIASDLIIVAKKI